MTQAPEGKLPNLPRRKLAVLACMDARLNVEQVLDLRLGDAHVIRNAGGIATDDAIRSIVISQHLLGTEEVIVIEHSECGMLTFQDADVHRHLVETTGVDIDLAFHAFPDLESNLREQVARIKAHPWTKDVPVRGMIYDVDTRELRELR